MGRPQHTLLHSHEGWLYFSLGISALSRLGYLSFGHLTKSSSTCYAWTHLDPGNKISGAQAHRGPQAHPGTVQYRIVALPPTVKGKQG